MIGLCSHSAKTGEGPNLLSQTDFEALLQQDVKAQVELSAAWLNIESMSNTYPQGSLKKARNDWFQSFKKLCPVINWSLN